MNQATLINSFYVRNGSSPLTLSFYEASDIVINYGIRPISIIGILFNIFTIILLVDKRFTHRFYDFLRCRCVCNLFVCLFGSYFMIFPDQGVVFNYNQLYLIWLGNQTPLRGALLSSFISENMLILNRIANLYNNKTSVFYSLSKKVKIVEYFILKGLFLFKLFTGFFHRVFLQRRFSSFFDTTPLPNEFRFISIHLKYLS